MIVHFILYVKPVKYLIRCYIYPIKIVVMIQKWRIYYGSQLYKIVETIKNKNMSKTQLIKDAKISTNAMAKFGRNEDVCVEVLVKICNALECNIEDIIELTKE